MIQITLDAADESKRIVTGSVRPDLPERIRMLEVEAKFRLPDPAAFRQRLTDLRAKFLGEEREADIYLGAPDRDFARTDEALRLRVGGEGTRLTYKGPRRDAITKTRTECETTIIPGEQAAAEMLKLFGHLGYRRVAEVRKLRRTHEFLRGHFIVHVCEDHVEKVGQFVEIEIIVDREDHYEAAKGMLFEIAAELRLTEQEGRCYLEQLLGHTTVPGGEKPC
ncbi:class IV adenylate cyclase [Zavarzinella formosa]|uniref:class IV adenylate cyclase n=1 Tax=Zavarzinella formosa TaxID=360055 RepID=UPI0003200B86|nr:class IV adenylate cyclase [Zavarzinella formosa]